MRQLRLVGIASGLALVACGSDDFSGPVADSGGVDSGVDAPPGQETGPVDGGIDAPIDTTCNKAGDVKACKAPGGGDGVETCLPVADGTLHYGPCFATACDSTAAPRAGEACIAAAQFTVGGLDGVTGGPAEGDTLPAHQVSIRHRFYADKFEVSVEEWNAWWNASPRVVPSDGALVYVSGAGDVVRWTAPKTGLVAAGTDLGSGCVLGKSPVPGKASISCVSYDSALAYCMSVGKRLPTEAEWELVATSGANANNWPWGNTAPDDSCTQAIDGPCYSKDTSAWPYLRPSAVAGNTASGVNNLAGNVAEWTLDLYPVGSCSVANKCWPGGTADPIALTDNGMGHVVRGGSYGSDASHVRTRSRNFGPADASSAGGIGFRCVRDER